MGSASYVSNLLGSIDSKLCPHLLNCLHLSYYLFIISDALSSASKVGTREGNSRVSALAVGIDAMTYGRGCGVVRGLGVAVALGIGVGVGAHGPGTTTATSSTNMLVKSPAPS